jgi:hypothetical protein
VIFFLNILMNSIVGKASKRKPSPGEKHFNFVSRRESPDAIEDVGGLVSSEH